MTDQFTESLTRLISRAYRPTIPFADRLTILVRAAVEATHSTQGKLCLMAMEWMGNEAETSAMASESAINDVSITWALNEECPVCLAFCEHHHHEPIVTHRMRREMRCLRLITSGGSSLAIPIHYQQAVLGVLVLASPYPHHYSSSRIELGEWFAQRIAYHIKRHHFQTLARTHVDGEWLLIGPSEILHQIDQFIERAALRAWPVLILGEAGTEKTTVALGLHLAGPHPHGPFIQVSGSTLTPDRLPSPLAELFHQARGGTLFLSELERLDARLQVQLVDLLTSGGGPWAKRGREHSPEQVRVIASINHDVKQLVKKGTLCPTLIEKLDVLRVYLPPLCERREDIAPLIEYFLHKHADSRPPQLADQVWTLCEQYPWPGNVSELERVIARLVALSNGQWITLRDIQTYAPELISTASTSTGWSLAERRRDRRSSEDRTSFVTPAPTPLSADDVIAALLASDHAPLGSLHAGLQKALIYMAQNFQEDITLIKAVEQACVSRSLLCRLFQETFGLTFTAFLARLRIEKAKRLLMEEPTLTVAEIAYRVGFGDLRHFQRTFKRLVGCPPSIYRHHKER